MSLGSEGPISSGKSKGIHQLDKYGPYSVLISMHLVLKLQFYIWQTPYFLTFYRWVYISHAIACFQSHSEVEHAPATSARHAYRKVTKPLTLFNFVLLRYANPYRYDNQQ